MLSAPKNIGFGIRVDGRDAGISFPTMDYARGGAIQLTTQGFRNVAVFDRISGHVVEHVAPKPVDA